MEQLKIEHYKSLKQEHQYYLTQVQQLWMFKLTTLGLVLAVGVLSDKLNSIGNVDRMSIITISLISLPIISLLIDLKVLEYSFQIKSISNHLIEKFKEIPEIYNWESKLWSRSPLTKQRTFLTIISSVGLSSCILIISFYFAYLIKPSWFQFLFIIALVLIVTLLTISLSLIPKLLK